MRHSSLASFLILAMLGCGQTTDVLGYHPAPESTPGQNPEDVLDPRIGVPPSDSQRAIRSAFEQLFFGDPDTEAVYREVDADAAYVEDIVHQDVRTDAIGYGMFVSVQLREQEVFDKLWTWAKRYMLLTEAPREGLLRWRCSTAGDGCEDVAATDATSFIATSLFMADSKWANTGAHPYREDANSLIDAMVQTEERNGGIVDNVQNLFDTVAMLPRRTTAANQEDLIQTDYLMPAFYAYWADQRPGDADFWRQAAAVSSRTLDLSPADETGLVPVLIDHDAAPAPNIDYYDEVAARVLLNRWFWQAWTGPNPWVLADNGRLLDFFLQQGDYVSSYFLNGVQRGDRNTVAHLSLAATAAAFTDRPEQHDVFLQALVDEPIPEGESRYYDGMLYLISLLAVSGNISR